MATFILKDGEQVRQVTSEKASAQVIPANSLVTLDGSELIIPAVAASTAVAFTRNGAAAGETTVDVTVGIDFTLVGTGDEVWAESNRGTEIDITNAQLIDLGTSSTDVLKAGIATDSGVVGATTNIEVRINKPLF